MKWLDSVGQKKLAQFKRAQSRSRVSLVVGTAGREGGSELDQEGLGIGQRMRLKEELQQKHGTESMLSP